MAAAGGCVNANPSRITSRMATPPDLLIAGGGIIGLTTAYLAAKAGMRVAVYDRGDLGQEASWAGAGILPPGDPGRAAAPLDRLRAVGSAGMAGLAAELRDLTGIDNGYRRCGGIEALGPNDLYASGLWAAEAIRHERLSPEGLHALEPEVGEVPGLCFHLPDCAQVRNPRHVRALVAACDQQGVRAYRNTPIAGWAMARSRVEGVRLANGETRAAGRFLVTAGAWSEGLLKPLGHAPGVHPVLGQIVLLKPERAVLSCVLMLGKEYLVPRTDGRVLVGSTEEPEAGFEKRTTADAVAGLRALAVRTVPALADAEVETCWAGLRPGSPDGWPFLGPVPGHDNVLVAAGHLRAGIQLSLGTAQVMVQTLPRRTDVRAAGRLPPRPPTGPGGPAGVSVLSSEFQISGSKLQNPDSDGLLSLFS